MVEKNAIENFKDFLGSDRRIPAGKASVFIGQRGVHKGHLALSYFIDLMAKVKSLGTGSESLLILSTDKNKSSMKNLIKNILRGAYSDRYYYNKDKCDDKEKGCNVNCSECSETQFCAKDFLIRNQKENRLEILYFPPVYITPEEFFHRIYVNVKRMKKRNPENRLNVLFDSLDQLSALFPLCVKEEIFIPSIVEFLNSEKVTSIFIAEEKDQINKQFGILPMADLILSFEKVKDLSISGYTEESRTVKVTVERFAGGKLIGNTGTVDLISQSDRGLYYIDFTFKQNLLDRIK